jgi:hypothetical protein
MISINKTVSPTFERVTLTPEDAATLLSLNTKNRRIKQIHVSRLANSISRGEWQFNAQPIQIADDGLVLDGQHRLLASVQSGISIDTLIVYGARAESQETMDMGVVRTIGDILTLRGFKNANNLAALINRIIAYNQSGISAAINTPGRGITPVGIVNFAEESVGLDEYVLRGKRLAKLLRTNPSLAGFLIWLTEQIDFEDSQYFWGKLESGAGLEAGSPIFTLREWALAPDRVRLASTADLRRDAAFVIKSWNKFRAGDELIRLVFRSGGANPEQFPEAK